MMNKLLIIGVVAFLIPGCAAPFSKYYYDETGGVDITTSSRVMLSDEEPKLIRGSIEEEDSLKMREDGFKRVGYSLFNGGNVDEKGAIIQAQKVHAAIVIIYSKYTGTESGVRTVVLPATQTSSTSFSGSTYGSGGYSDFSGKAQTKTQGIKTTYIPYNVRRSDYLATYWVKGKRPKFGADFKDLTSEIKQEMGSNKGLLIDAVVKGSPAFQADILRGDVLRKIEDIEIYSFEKVVEAVNQYQGHKVSVVIYRNGKEIRKEITFNTD